MRRLALALLVPLLGGCAAGTTCPSGTGTPMLVANLFFGRAIGGRGDLTDTEWARFVDRVVTPALPAGYTMFDAEGAWMNPATRVTSRERTKVLIAAMPDTPERIAALGDVRKAYETMFHQQRVGMTVRRECALF